MPTLTRDQAVAEIERRYSKILSAITPISLASGLVNGVQVVHEWTLKILTSLVQNLCLICSRRAGKTWAICCLLLLTALATPNCNSLYLALVGGQSKKVYSRIWKRLLIKNGLLETTPLVRHSETELVTTFYNGSTVTFGGVDDLRHVQTLLGSSMASGLAVVDESQSGVASVLQSLIDDVLSPMLDETTEQHPIPGRLVVAGTQPTVRAGYLYDLKERISHDPDLADTWQLLRWSRFQNPFLTDNDKRLSQYLKKTGRSKDDPLVLANWYGLDVYDEKATAYGYRADRNQWSGAWLPALVGREWFPTGTSGHAVFVQPPAGVDTFIVGMDPAATSDRMGIVLWGWSSVAPLGLWHCGEWVTKRAANVLESHYFAVLKTICQHYHVIAIVRDAGSASTTQDPAFLSEWGLVIEPAKKGKGSVKARVNRLADLLGSGRARVLAGSELEQDLKLARFEPTARADGKYEWTSDCHPDVADAATYPLPSYIETIETKKKTPLELEQEEEKAAWQSVPVEYGPETGSDPGNSGYGCES